MDGHPRMSDDEHRLRKQKAHERADRKRHMQVNHLVVPPQRHISVDGSELKLALRSRLPIDERPDFDDFCKLIEGVAAFDFFDLKKRMREEFLPFAAGAKNETHLQRSSRPLPSTAQLDGKEEDFIADVYEVLRASHYHLMTSQEWEIATAEDFQLSLPVEVNWEYMDDQMLKKFWESDPEYEEIRKELPDELADRILVFHRGVGTAKMSGLLIDQKLDLLMNYTVFYIVDLLKEKFQQLMAKKKPAATPDQPAAEQQQEVQEGQQQQEPRLPRVKFAARGSSDAIGSNASSPRHPRAQLRRNTTEAYSVQGNTFIQSTHKYAKTVERRTLERQCPTLVTLLKAFPQKMELQEPTFKDIIVLYRKAMPPRVPPKASNRRPSKTDDERLQGILNYRNIVLKVFGETAMADMEVVFPDKKVSIKPFQLVNMAVTVIMALVTFAITLLKAGDKINMNVVWTAASFIGTRLFTVYSQAQQQRTNMQQEMSAMLYDKMQDSGAGVVTVMMEEMADQQVKQMLMAYVLLLSKCGPDSRGLLEDDLDNACEGFLVKDFNHYVDFEVDAALKRLKRWQLVQESSEGRLVPIPIKEAIAILESAWREAYKQLGQSSQQSTRDMIDGTGSSFGKGIDEFRRRRLEEANAEQNAALFAARSTLSKTKDMMGGLLGSKKDKSVHKEELNGHSSPSPAAQLPLGEQGSGGLARAGSDESTLSTSKKSSKKSLLKKLLH